jgi:hypothetical protein
MESLGVRTQGVKTSEELKKELAEEEQDGYDTPQENLLAGSEVRVLR